MRPGTCCLVSGKCIGFSTLCGRFRLGRTFFMAQTGSGVICRIARAESISDGTKLVSSRDVGLTGPLATGGCPSALELIICRSFDANGICEFLAGGFALSTLAVTRLCERE